MKQGASEVALEVMGVGQIERCKVCLERNGLNKHSDTRESLDFIDDYVVSRILNVLKCAKSENFRGHCQKYSSSRERVRWDGGGVGRGQGVEEPTPPHPHPTHRSKRHCVQLSTCCLPPRASRVGMLFWQFKSPKGHVCQKPHFPTCLTVLHSVPDQKKSTVFSQSM